MTEEKVRTTTDAGQDVERRDHGCLLVERGKVELGGFLRIQTCRPTWPRRDPLGIYPRELKASVHTQTHTQTFLGSLFGRDPNRNWHRCPSTGDGWANRGCQNKDGPSTPGSTAEQHGGWAVTLRPADESPGNYHAKATSVVSGSLRPCGLCHARLLCPWNSQTRIQDWVIMHSSRGSSRPGDRTCVSYISCTGRWVLYH